MPYDRATETLTLDVEDVVHRGGGVYDVFVRSLSDVGIDAGGFPPAPGGLSVLPVPGFRGWLDIRYEAVLDPSLIRYEWRRTFDGLPPEAAVSGGLRTWLRVASPAGVFADYQVRAVNASGAGVWSAPVRAAGGYLDGMSLSDWGRLPSPEPAAGGWAIPFDTAGWAAIAGVAPGEAAWAVEGAPAVVLARGWGRLPDVDGVPLAWQVGVPAPVLADGWERLSAPVPAEASWSVGEEVVLATGWGRMERAGGAAAAWVRGVRFSSVGWGNMPSPGVSAASWHTGASEPPGWGLLGSEPVSALSWRVS